jgi:hypothetical protein
MFASLSDSLGLLPHMLVNLDVGRIADNLTAGVSAPCAGKHCDAFAIAHETGE